MFTRFHTHHHFGIALDSFRAPYFLCKPVAFRNCASAAGLEFGKPTSSAIAASSLITTRNLASSGASTPASASAMRYTRNLWAARDNNYRAYTLAKRENCKFSVNINSKLLTIAAPRYIIHT
jgi:hypothetical protein